MRRFFLSMLTAVMAISMVSCEYDDSELTGRVNDLEGRVQTLEQLCSQMNTNITAMQAIVNALQTQDAITAVTPITEGGKVIGYTITFVKGDPITIYHGQDGQDGANGKDGADGEDGYTPVIGVDQAEDGEYYWTLDGEWLTDTEGNKIATSGKDGADGEDGTTEQGGMPQLKIQGGYWYVSYDGGETWERLGRATGYDGSDGKDGQNGKNGDAFFDDVDDSNADYVVFELTDGTTFKVPKYKEFSVEIKPVIDYVVVGDVDLQLKYVVSNCPNPTVLVISDLQTSISDGFITVKAPTSTAGLDSTETITLLVSNGSTTVMASVDITVADVVAKSTDELSTAITNGLYNIILKAGTYNIPAAAKGKTLTITGSTGDPKDVVITVVPGGQGEANGQLDYGLDGSTVTFNNLTIKTNNQTYAGYARLTATFNNCIMDQCFCLNGNSTFNNCTLNVSGDQYNIWTWGAPTATFTNCTFNSDGKAMLLYGTANTKLTINSCVFNDSGVLPDLKAAIEIGNDYDKSYELIVNDTVVNGYEINDKGINTGTTLWANKSSMGTDQLNVVVDGVDVY